MNITLTGIPGAGKSSVTKKLEEYNFKKVSSGDIFRNKAKELNISVIELNKRINEEIEFYGKSSLDKEIDERIIDISSMEDNLVIDSRVGYYFAKNSYNVFLYCDPWVAAYRIYSDNRAQENYKDTNDSLNNVYKRMRLEQKRFWDLYKTDPYNLANYDLVIDTTQATPDVIADTIWDYYNKKNQGILISPFTLYPTQVIRDFNNDVIEEYKNDNSDIYYITGYLHRNHLFILDGHHRVISTALKNNPYIDIELEDDRDLLLDKSNYYDFEELLAKGFRYTQYPSDFENEADIISYDFNVKNNKDITNLFNAAKFNR